MADFKIAYDSVQKQEGGYADLDGGTYAGITYKYYPKWEGWPVVNSKKPLANNAKIPELAAAVERFYKTNQWPQIMGDQIKNNGVALVLFDFFVNAGNNAIKVLQKVLNAQGADLSVDGAMGPKTLEAVNKADPNKLLSAFTIARMGYYKGIAPAGSDNEGFLKGWIFRAANALKEAEKYVSAGDIIIALLLLVAALFLISMSSSKKK